MLTEFMYLCGLDQLSCLGLDCEPYTPEGDLTYDWLYANIRTIAYEAEDSLPEYMKDEFRGIRDGMNDAGYDNITYDEVVGLNQGMDGLFYLLAALLQQTPNKKTNVRVLTSFLKLVHDLNQADVINVTTDEKGNPKVELPKLEEGKMGLPRFGCNEFIVGGNATSTGETFHGRDFMFGTYGIFEHTQCIMVYLPTKGNPFVAVGPPAFVGHTVALNSEGISIAQDISVGNNWGENFHLGSLLMVRHIAQNSNALAEAVELFKNTPRGMPWLYAVADDETDPLYGPGVILEAGGSDVYFDGPDVLPKRQQELLAEEIALLETEQAPIPDRGVAVRDSSYILPGSFEATGLVLPVQNPFFTPLVPYDNEFNRWDVGLYFPPTIEEFDEVVVGTNHFSTPRMRFLQFHPIIALLYGSSGDMAESIWRYEHMVGDITGLYGTIDFFGDDPELPAEGSAAWIIDFLNSGRCEFYTGDNSHIVQSHHTIINNTTKEVRSLFGYMDDPWVTINMDLFAGFFLEPQE